MSKKSDSDKKGISRRSFVSGASAATAAAFTIVPRRVLGGPGYKAPSDKLNIACIGVGGKGRSDTRAAMGENIVALCDVDDTQMAKFKDTIKDDDEALAWFDKVKKYKDFRVMLEQQKDIDAITVSTPDHTHAVAAMMALKMEKHVFVQKPMTHTIHEARALAKEAAKAGVATQMGNQGHAGEGARLINEWIWDGAIGEVYEVHCWTNRPIWPQGIEAPKEKKRVPKSLDWDLWLGPAAMRPYHPAYVPFRWRGWWDFGTGAIGDMGAHIIDHPYWALKLTYPKTVSADSTQFTDDSYPVAEVITYTFPSRGLGFPEVKLTWWDGGLRPPRPVDLEPGRQIGDNGGGIVFVGTKGKLMSSVYGNNPRLIPETAMRAYDRPEKTIPRSPGIMAEWIEAAKTGKKSSTDFSYSGPLTETMLLGCLAVRVKDENTILEWDGDKGEITNLEKANEYLHMPYRDGWTL